MTENPRPKLGHFGVFVHDVERMARFYSDVIGLMVTDRGPVGPDKRELVFMSADPSEHHQFALMEGRPDDVGFNVIQQMSFVVGSLDELRVLYGRLVDDGCKIERSVSHGNALSVYFFDPEGNRAEVYCHTRWHVPQPHAMPIDLSLPPAEIERLAEADARASDGFMMAADYEKAMAEKLQA
jgi:catechol 2,3-dioxygenase